MEKYSYEDFLSARRRAEDEAREMYTRAYTCEKESPPKSTEYKPCCENRPNLLNFLPGPFGNLLNGIFKDSDTLLILGLVFILASDKADKLLIFALIYILM